MPPAYPAEDFVVPEGVVGIFKGAFDGCHFRTMFAATNHRSSPKNRCAFFRGPLNGSKSKGQMAKQKKTPARDVSHHPDSNSALVSFAH